MDPNACWTRIQEALRDNDTQEAVNGAVDLGGWINGGGAYPAPGLVCPEPRGTDHRAATWAVLNFLMTLGIEAN